MPMPFPTTKKHMIQADLGHRTILLEDTAANRELLVNLMSLKFFERIYSADYQASCFAPVSTPISIRVDHVDVTELTETEAYALIKAERELIKQADAQAQLEAAE